MKLLIFDIDGTLTHLDGSTRRAFNVAFLRIYGVPAVLDGLKMHGRTDPVIFRDCFQLTGLSGNWIDHYPQFCEVYLDVLPGEITQSAKSHLMPGIPELLNELDLRRPQACLALGTGNMEAGARKKIGHWNLNRYFPVGGFGDRHEERTAMLRDAVTAAEQHYRACFAPEKTWVIGDTIHDIEGGKALGLKTMGVATGGAFSYDDLIHSGADIVFRDLAETETVLKAFGL